MNKFVIAVLIHVALALFFVVAIWPALQGDNDRYNGVGDAPVAVATPTETTELAAPIAEEFVETEPEVVVEDIAPTPVEPVELTGVEVATVEEGAEIIPDLEVETAEAKIHIVTTSLLKYKPLVVMISPGDTVAWEKMATHDTQSLVGLIPDAAEMWHSAMGENYQRTFTHEGIYIYKCTPHFGGGMGGVIIVGKPVNLQVIKDAPVKGAAKRLVKKAIKAAEAM